MDGSPVGRRSRRGARSPLTRAWPHRAGPVLAVVAAAATAISVALPAPEASAAPRGPIPPSLQKLVDQIRVLSAQIDSMGQQYDLLHIQYQQAQQQVAIAKATISQDQKLIATDQAAVAQIASVGYMSGGVSPTLQLLQSSDPQTILARASILSPIQFQNSTKLQLVASARAAAARTRASAIQAEQRAGKLSGAMQAQVARIQAKENVLNSQEYSQALAYYQQTGSYPNISIPGDSIGVQALKYALTKIGDWYVWGAAGPSTFDCSGLVVWAYAQIGISLPHYTGWLWNSGPHVAQADLKPGDLVFFFPTISHVGIYIGNGLMLDAPSTGQQVQIQAIYWSSYVGAVRIV